MRIARPVLLRSTIEIQPWILSLVYQGTNRAEVPVACQGYGYCFPSLLSCLALLGLFDRRGLYFLGDPSRSLLQLTLSTPPGSFSGEAEQEYPRSTGPGTSSYCSSSVGVIPGNDRPNFLPLVSHLRSHGSIGVVILG